MKYLFSSEVSGTQFYYMCCCWYSCLLNEVPTEWPTKYLQHTTVFPLEILHLSYKSLFQCIRTRHLLLDCHFLKKTGFKWPCTWRCFSIQALGMFLICYLWNVMQSSSKLSEFPLSIPHWHTYSTSWRFLIIRIDILLNSS